MLSPARTAFIEGLTIAGNTDFAGSLQEDSSVGASTVRWLFNCAADFFGMCVGGGACPGGAPLSFAGLLTGLSGFPY